MFRYFSADQQSGMPLWSEDLSLYSLDEVILTQSENRAWHKELRLKTNLLLNSRLAKQISREEYTANRQVGVADETECKRRAAKLVNEITARCAR